MTKFVVALMFCLFAVGAQAQTCTAVKFNPGESGAYVQGNLPPESLDCYTLAVRPGQNVFIEVVVGGENVAITVVDVADARRRFDFAAPSSSVEFRVFQMFRSARAEDYAILVQVE
ncbi:hypothetical protein [Paracoccus tegillarcae]|uniref:Uncharacterized protein n=1 Tax=Paracoccus tegillarcae TaxID=1529068 RepID=A0A2K9EZB8_9RHOB|nr:hypothetical protein [Paracoccus tegillarcae]AUH33452.1 hypothetical protein CUV01_08655 [Paracoccus tegillarcae]